jgi:hypothetical protein
MDIAKIMATKAANKLHGNSIGRDSFKAVMDQKRAQRLSINKPQENLNLKSMVNDVVKNHETAAQTIKTFMTRTDYSPERLIAIQYRTGLLFLREQMHCKTAELSANTFKNFTQMQL